MNRLSLSIACAALLLGCGGGSADNSSTASGGSNSGSSGSGGSAAGSGGEAGSGNAGTGGAAGAAGNAGSGAQAGSAGQGGAGGSAISGCETPDAAVMAMVPSGATLTFSTLNSDPVEVGTASDENQTEPDAWTTADQVVFPNVTGQEKIKIFARVVGASCRFEHVYTVTQQFAPQAGEPGTTAIAADDTSIQGWAKSVADVQYGSGLGEMWKTPDKALGPAQSTALDVVSLGEGGSIILMFDPPLTDGSGPDLAVLENSFSPTFLELAYVEVSSNGVDFVRFDSAYLGANPLGSFDTQEPALITGLAGKYVAGFGTPFDLNDLRYRAATQAGVVDLSAITHVRIVDIVGDGHQHDSFGRPIYDPTPTTDSAGFDLEAVAAINTVGN